MTSASATASPAATFALRPGFIYNQSASEKILAVERRDGLFRFSIVADFGEAEPARLPRETIAQQRQRIGLDADFRKQRCHLLFRCLERQISHVQFLHSRSPLPLTSARTPNARLKRQDLGRRRPYLNQPHPAEASAPVAQEHLAASAASSQPSQS